jgi:alpha-beta hydrolase superfamily lysophospholipase
MLFAHGTNDPVVDPVAAGNWGKAVRDRVDTNVTYRSYENAPHVLLKSPWRAEVARDMLAFIIANLNE